jgi:long-chain acyl-CoA synthetase
MEVKIDSEDPENVVGEIMVKGESVMNGYYKNQAATDAIFTEDGWMKTGDLGVIDPQGNIFIRGRNKDMI